MLNIHLWLEATVLDGEECVLFHREFDWTELERELKGPVYKLCIRNIQYQYQLKQLPKSKPKTNERTKQKAAPECCSLGLAEREGQSSLVCQFAVGILTQQSLAHEPL